MKRKNYTRSALLTSIISLLLCVSMLVGTTFAWFTDEVNSTGNKIQAGTLQIDLLVRDDAGEYTSVKESQDPIFDYDLWEPGYTEAVNVKVVNTGTLALQYALQIVTDGLVDELLNSKTMLSDVIDVYYADEEVVLADRAAFYAAVADGSLKLEGTLTDVIFGGAMINDTLLAGTEDCATIVLHMQETAGNEYQNLSVGTKFDMKLFATQYTYEEDSFDDQYDKIEKPAATLMVLEPELLEAYDLDAGCAFLTTETWNDSWDYDEENDTVAEGTPEYAYYFADFVISFNQDHAANDVGLWGYYASWGAEESFKMDAIEAGKEYRVIATAAEKLNIPMGSISYRQLLDQVQAFGCGVVKESLNEGETITVKLRLYETKLNGNTSFSETGAYHDVAVYTYTHAARPVYTATGLQAALENGGNVTLGADINTDAQLAVNGGTLDGNGKTITSTYSGTGTNAGVEVSGGTISNLTIANGDPDAAKGLRAVYVTNPTADIYIKNCVLDGTYTININSSTNAYGLYVTDTTLNGWTSYGSAKEAVFTGCTFGEGSTGYANLRPYATTELKNCEFAKGFTITRNSTEGTAFTITLTGCTVNGVAVTADNFAELLAGDATSAYALQTCTWITVVVDGETVTW